MISLDSPPPVITRWGHQGLAASAQSSPRNRQVQLWSSLWVGWNHQICTVAQGSPCSVCFLIPVLSQILLPINFFVQKIYLIGVSIALLQHESAIRHTCWTPSLLNPRLTSLPAPLLQVVTNTSFQFPMSYIKLSLSNLCMVMYMFQCCSLKSSHPLLLPLCPKVCSLCLCLLCCPSCRIIDTVFLDSMYMC